MGMVGDWVFLRVEGWGEGVDEGVVVGMGNS